MSTFNLTQKVKVSSGHVDANFEVTSLADRDALITNGDVRRHHILAFASDAEPTFPRGLYELKEYPTFKSTTGVIWTSLGSGGDIELGTSINNTGSENVIVGDNNTIATSKTLAVGDNITSNTYDGKVILGDSIQDSDINASDDVYAKNLRLLGDLTTDLSGFASALQWENRPSEVGKIYAEDGYLRISTGNISPSLSLFMSDVDPDGPGTNLVGTQVRLAVVAANTDGGEHPIIPEIEILATGSAVLTPRNQVADFGGTYYNGGSIYSSFTNKDQAWEITTSVAETITVTAIVNGVVLDDVITLTFITS